jgi:2-phospho-L-lactate guanylyltransferase
MKTVLLPIKEFRHAKQRLASALDSDFRENDVLNALAQAHAPDRVVVFTASEEVAEIVRPMRFDVVFETTVNGHSAAVNYMVSELAATASEILSIAGDLPKLRPEEIDFVLNSAAEPITVLPSRDGTGTNGVVFVPPARIAMEYGEGSFRRHLSKARAAGLRADVMNIPGIAFDVDTPEDLQAFMDNPRTDGRTWRYLLSRRRG